MLVVSSYQKNYIPLLTKDGGVLKCPICNITGKLKITFYQMQTETSGGITNTKQVTASVFCSSCLHDVPNVRWSDELNNFFKIEKKQIKVNASFKTKRGLRIALRILVGFAIVIVAVAVFAVVIKFLKQH